MRVLANAETAARALLDAQVSRGYMSAADADRMLNYSLRTVLQTVGNLRRRKHSDEQITEGINRMKVTARLKVARANTLRTKNLAARDYLMAQLHEAIWKGMQADADTYRYTR